MQTLSGTYTINEVRLKTETGHAGGEQAVTDAGTVVLVRVHTYDNPEQIAKLIKEALEGWGIRLDSSTPSTSQLP